MYMKVTFLWREGRFCKIKQDYVSSNFSSVLKSRVFIYNIGVGEIGREKGRKVVSGSIRDRKRGRDLGGIERENPMDRGAWKAAVHGVTEGRTPLSNFTFTFHFHALEKEMATHSSVLAWRIPGTEEPGGLPSMGLHRVGHD